MTMHTSPPNKNPQPGRIFGFRSVVRRLACLEKPRARRYEQITHGPTFLHHFPPESTGSILQKNGSERFLAINQSSANLKELPMHPWKSLLKSDPIDWLLEPENPSVRYYTLTDLLDKPASGKDVKATKSSIMEKGPVPAILEHQTKEGFWGEEKNFYRGKYTGTVWQLLVLAELCADPKHPGIKNACEFILEHSQERQYGGFAYDESVKTGGGRPTEVVPCLTGNMLWALIRLGRLRDARVQKAIDWVNSYRRFDDNDGPAPKGVHYDRYEMCWGRHTCHMGIVKTLKALAEIPAEARSNATRLTIKRAVDYLLRHYIYKKSHDLSSISKPGWLKPGFPLMYQTDILEILLILTRLGTHDIRMRDAFDILLSKQDNRGRWKLENSYNGKFLVDIEKKGKPSKWITLNALRVIKNFVER